MKKNREMEKAVLRKERARKQLERAEARVSMERLNVQEAKKKLAEAFAEMHRIAMKGVSARC